MRVDISVQGTVTNEDMRSQVYALRDRLVEIINSTLDKLPSDILTDIPPVSEDTFVSEEEEVLVSEDISESSVQPSTEDKIDILQKRMKKLDDVLLDGQISESRHKEMRTRIERIVNEITSLFVFLIDEAHK